MGEQERLASLITRVNEAVSDIKSLSDEMQSIECSTDKGISLLHVRNTALLHYNLNLLIIAMHKMHGRSIVGLGAVLRSTHIRTVLDKLRPIEAKLSTQIDQILSFAHDQPVAGASRARPDMIVVDGDEEAESDGEKEMDVDKRTTTSGSRKYVPPKVAPMHYDGDDTNNKVDERRKRRTMNSSLIRELHEQYTDAPIEIREEGDSGRRKHIAEQRARKKYEEENFVRLQMSKKKTRQSRSDVGRNTLDALLDFGDYGMAEQTSENATKKPGDEKKHTKKQAFGKKKKFSGKRKR